MLLACFVLKFSLTFAFGMLFAPTAHEFSMTSDEFLVLIQMYRYLILSYL